MVNFIHTYYLQLWLLSGEWRQAKGVTMDPREAAFRRLVPSSRAPILIHCRDGIEKSGVLLLADNVIRGLLRASAHPQDFDIRKIAMKIYKQLLDQRALLLRQTSISYSQAVQCAIGFFCTPPPFIRPYLHLEMSELARRNTRFLPKFFDPARDPPPPPGVTAPRPPTKPPTTGAQSPRPARPQPSAMTLATIASAGKQREKAPLSNPAPRALKTSTERAREAGRSTPPRSGATTTSPSTSRAPPPLPTTTARSGQQPPAPGLRRGFLN